MSLDISIHLYTYICNIMYTYLYLYINANFHSEDCIDQDCFNETNDCETCLTHNRLAFQSIKSYINTADYENTYIDDIFSYRLNNLSRYLHTRGPPHIYYN